MKFYKLKNKNMTGNIDDLFAFTFTTYDRILKDWGQYGHEALSLYIRYIKQAKLQKTNETKSLDYFMQESMWWGDKKFKKVKKILVELWLIEQIRWYKGNALIKVNYIIWQEKTEAVSDRVKMTPSKQILDRVILDRVKMTLQNIYKEVIKYKNISNKIIYPQNSFFYKISRDFLDFQIWENVHQILFLLKKESEKIFYKDLDLEKYDISEFWTKEKFREEIWKIIIANKWAEEIRKLQEIDWYTEEQIQFVLDFTKKDNFRKDQILSIKKFRQKNKDDIPYFVVMIDEIKKTIQKQKRNNIKREITFW